MGTPMCNACQIFLFDYLTLQIHKDLPLAKQMSMKSLKYIQAELADWIYRFYKRVPKEEFEKALKTASNIARRGRPLHEYESLLHTATFNFLKFSNKWIHEEVQYIQPLLLESGFIRSNQKNKLMSASYDYISYTLPRVFLLLNDLHKDHLEPKGIYTDGSKMLSTQDDKGTCYDGDLDYQTEILNEVDLRDLYT